MKLNKIILTVLTIFLLAVLNIFFYSFITISLYKLICYESNTLLAIVNDVLSNKICNVYYLFDDTTLFFLLGYDWYNVTFNNYLYLSTSDFFFSTLLGDIIQPFYFFFDCGLKTLHENN